MTETTTQTEDAPFSTTDGKKSPFQTTNEGYFIITSPVGGTPPDELSMTIDGVTYHFSEYMGTIHQSRFMPNTICYRSLEVKE